MTEAVTVCVVDDEVDILKVVSANLRDTFYISSFESPIAALEAFENGFQPNVVISDLRMPDMDGIQFIETLLERKAESDIIILSGHAEKVDAMKAVNMGIFGFMEKPFVGQELKQMVSDAVQHSDEKTKAIASFADDLLDLNILYFDRLVKAENLLTKHKIKTVPEGTSSADAIQLLRRERLLTARIEEAKKKIFRKI